MFPGNSDHSDKILLKLRHVDKCSAMTLEKDMHTDRDFISHLKQQLQELVQLLPMAHPVVGLPALTRWAASHPALTDESAIMHSHCGACLLACSLAV